MTTVVPTSEEDPAISVVHFTAEISWADAGPVINSAANYGSGIRDLEVFLSRPLPFTLQLGFIQFLVSDILNRNPHLGNLAIDVDESLIYYDFGMMEEIKSFTRERLLDLFYTVYEKDANKEIKTLIDLEALQLTCDMSSVRRSVQFFLDNLLSQTPDKHQTLSAIGEDLFAIATDQPFRFPTTFAFVIRAFCTLEDVTKLLKARSIEAANEMVRGEKEHCSSWLAGRIIKKKGSKDKAAAATTSSASSLLDQYIADLTSRIHDQLTQEMDEKVDKKVRENVKLVISKLVEKNPKLKVDINELSAEPSTDFSVRDNDVTP